MTPSEFMLYATPVILLISQEVRAYLAKRELKRVTEQQTAALKSVSEQQTAEINGAGQERAEVLQSNALDTATKLALHTSEKANALGDELIEIHEIVNGNTTALKNRVAELEAQLKSANRHT